MVKFNFKKWASVLASCAMLASTIGFAAGLSYSTFTTKDAIIFSVTIIWLVLAIIFVWALYLNKMEKMK